MILAEVVTWPPMTEDLFVGTYRDWRNGFDMENVEFGSEPLSETEYDSENDSDCEHVEFLSWSRAAYEQEYGPNTILFETGHDPEYDRRIREFRFHPDTVTSFVLHQDMVALRQNTSFAIQHYVSAS